jgi:tryptophan 2,3-dioxygenase
MPSDHAAALTYSSYLALDEILGAQRPRSEEHDEMLFIVIHQVYELWFKQLLHELARLQRRLEAGEAPHALSTLKRILTILKTIGAQIDVLETMTPRQFTSFRGRLAAASGFQSMQFRELEAVLGRRDAGVLEHYPPGSEERRRVAAAMVRPSLFGSFLRYLSGRGYAVPRAALARDVAEPMQEWRYRHVKMVERTIGDKKGTGGSSGAAYLRATLFEAAFPDLWAVRGEL